METASLQILRGPLEAWGRIAWPGAIFLFCAALVVRSPLAAAPEEKAASKEAAKPEAKEEAKPEAKEAPKAEAKPEAKEAPKAEAKAEVKLEVKDAQGADVLKILNAETAVRKAVQARIKAQKVVEGQPAPEAPAAAKPETAQAGEKTEKTEKTEAPKVPEKKKEPQPPMFRLREGTKLSGTPDLKILHVTTAYGKLVVPVEEVVRVRFASLRDPALASKIEENVRDLGSEEFDRRELAMTALRGMGPQALPALKKALESEDEEVKTRAEKLVSEIEEEVSEAEADSAGLGPILGEEDEVVSVRFTITGRVEEETISLATRYGNLKLDRKDIVSIVFREDLLARTTFQVPGNTFAGANKWFDTKLTLTQGESLHMVASGVIQLENYGQSTGPEGTTNISGNQLENFPYGCLVAKIGDKGKPFLVGSEYQGNASASGKLFLGVGIQNGQASGQFQVEVETEGEKQ